MDPPPPSQPQPPDALVVHWNDFLVASLLGLPDVEIDRLLEVSQGEMTGLTSPPSPPSKRPRYHSPPVSPSPLPPPPLPPPPQRRLRCRYRHLQLRSGLTFHFSDDDGKELLTTPSQEPNLFLRKLLSKLPTTLRGRLAFLAQFDTKGDPSQNDIVDADMEETDEWFLPATPEEADPMRYLFHDLREELYHAYLREMKMRRVFRTLLQRWRIRRIHRKPTPSEIDPITLQPPCKTVTLYDMAHDTRYIYDAQSLATWVESNLTHHEGGFATPQFPRNPWTNTPFTYLQLISLYQQLQSHGEVRWGLATLRQHDFQIARWECVHSTALTLSAIRQSLTRLDSVYGRDMLTDFIFMKMEDLHLYTNHTIRSVYHEAVSRFPTHWYIEALKGVAYLYYEAEHMRQNRRRQIHSRCDRIFQRQEDFFDEMGAHGIGVSDEYEDDDRSE